MTYQESPTPVSDFLGMMAALPLFIVGAPFIAIKEQVDMARIRREEAARLAARRAAAEAKAKPGADFYANLYAKRSRYNRPYLGK